MTGPVSRRRMLASLGAGAGGLLLTGCDKVNSSPAFRELLRGGETLTMKAQRLLLTRNALAPEYAPEDMSPIFRTNGNVMPSSAAYQAHLASGFASWRLAVDGLVERPLSLSMEQIRRMPTRSQITRHDCVEGWSAIGKWPYSESIDLIDAFHPQTILAWGMNDQPLPVGHGAPLRVRIERQLGYKMAKFVMRVEAVNSFAAIGHGKGGFWEDVAAYQWYAGI